MSATPATAGEPRVDLVRRAYHGAAAGWASGAELVYGPLARALAARCPVPLAGARAADAGSGTGALSRAFGEAGARAVAFDTSAGMLAFDRAAWPVPVVADVVAFPLRDAAVDVAGAAFVLNHLDRPVDGLAELRRVVRPGGAVLASVFSSRDRLPAKDLLDQIVRSFGWAPPDWYRWVRTVDGLVGGADDMAAAAHRAGLTDVDATEDAVDVGIERPEDVVRYRLSLPHVAPFVDALDPVRRSRLVDRAVRALDGWVGPLRPVVVLLTARTPSR